LALACNGDGGDDTGEDSDSAITYEPGCILVNGGDGYANLVDALAVAPAGATVTLCEVVDEEVVISKAVTIEGNGVTLRPPVNTNAITVAEGGDLTISDIVVETTRSAFLVQTGGKLALSDAELTVVPNYGIEIQTGGEAAVDGVTMMAPAWGGAKVDGGSLTLTNSVIEGAGSYGVFAENDAEIVLEGNQILGATLTLNDANLFDIDGVGVWLETGTNATLRNNQVVGADIAGLSGDDIGNLSLDGDVFLGGFAGLTIRNAKLSASNVDVTSYFRYGLVCLLCTDAVLNSVVIETDPESSAIKTLDADGSIGLFGIESSMTVTGTVENPSRFAGNNEAGVLMSPRDGGRLATLDISNAVVENNAAFGIAIYQDELTMADVDVVGTRNNDEACITETGYACNMAVALWGASGTMTGGSVVDSQDWGVTLVNGVLDVTGGLFARNQRYGLFAQSGSVAIDGTTFAEGKEYQVALFQSSSAVIQNATFRDGKHISEFEYDAGDGTLIRQVNHYQARDVYQDGGELIIQKSTFQNGEFGISSNGFSAPATVQITDSTFKGYNQNLFNASQNSSWDVSRVEVQDIGNYPINCYQSDMSFDKVKVNNVTKYKYRFEYYQDGELLFDSNFESTGRGAYSYQCDLSFEDTTFEGSDGQMIYAFNTTLETDGLSVRNAMREPGSSAAVDLQWTQVTEGGSTNPRSYPSGILQGLTIEGVGGGADALRIASWVEPSTSSTPGALAAGTVTLSQVKIGGTGEDGIAGDGVDASNLADLVIEGIDITNTGAAGLRLSQSNATITGAVGSSTGVIDSSGDDGIVFDADRRDQGTTKLTLADVTVRNPKGDGLTLTKGSHDIAGLTVTGAGSYGAVCVEATFDVCDATLDGVSGQQNGCGTCE
jgi:hypothetical protein